MRAGAVAERAMRAIEAPGPARIERPDSVLFACTRNSVRSPMAEGLLKALHPRRIYTDSAGIREGTVDGFSVSVMAELGIDISGHRSKTFDQLEDTYFDLIITLSPEAQHRAVELTRTMACDIELWHTFDPSIIEGSRETRLDAYRQVRDQLRRRIVDRFPVDAQEGPGGMTGGMTGA
jgi:protein-tyrosine-phosphatase